MYLKMFIWCLVSFSLVFNNQIEFGKECVFCNGDVGDLRAPITFDSPDTVIARQKNPPIPPILPRGHVFAPPTLLLVQLLYLNLSLGNPAAREVAYSASEAALSLLNKCHKAEKETGIENLCNKVPFVLTLAC